MKIGYNEFRGLASFISLKPVVLYIRLERILVNEKRQVQRKKTNNFILLLINKYYIRAYYLNEIGFNF